ncbi:hypothetical protein [Herpetosiphon geysericola]|uniref:Uncharacterized protein n=1 Tax=Herpetosiphon geysericola TaxID=70996 RepID=A0A0P6YDZ4_9CHLR|nr:hypothetical protein [Herpetosiphon geysericola]KPL80259.1 hypothetical protein SE18_24720 [Herpetosiphon geysericola]
MAHTKSVTYNFKNRDFDAYVNGEYVGSFPTDLDARMVCNRLVLELIELDNRAVEEAEAVMAVTAVQSATEANADAGEESTTFLMDEEARAGVASFEVVDLIPMPVVTATTYVNTPIDALARTMVILSRNWQRAIRAGRYADAERIEAHEQAVRSQFRSLSCPSLPITLAAQQRTTTSRRINY